MQINKIQSQLKSLTDIFDIVEEMDHFNTELSFDFINKFDGSSYRYKINFWEIQNQDIRAQKMIYELNQIKLQFKREHKLSLIL